jgi:hypothetical protein
MRFLHGIGVSAIAVALLAGAVKLQAVREASYPQAGGEDEETLYVTSGAAIRRLTGAYNAVAADAYWIRAIQYYGGTKRRLTSNPLAPELPPTITAADEYREL